MKAKEAFDFNLHRARNLLRLYELRREAGAKHTDVDDLLRSSVVLAVGAIDAYVHDKVSENLVPFVKRALRNSPGDVEPIEKALKQAEVQTRDYLTWLTYDRPFVKVRQVIDARLSLESLQHPGSIQTAFSLIGRKGVWPTCAKVLGLNEQDLSERLVGLTRRRNQIVHEGDREKSRLRKHKERKIAPDWVSEQLAFADRLVGALERCV